MNHLYYKDRYSGGILRVCFRFGRYMANDSLYVEMCYFNEEDKQWEPYATLTVCLPDEMPADLWNCAFLNTNGEVDSTIAMWLISNGFARKTGDVGVSGFCTFPEFRFDLQAMRPYAMFDAEWLKWCQKS